MSNIKKAKYIWLNNSKYDENEYVDFLDTFTIDSQCNITIKISSISEYVLYINDKFVGFNQYPNYKDIKYYDEYCLNDYVSIGTNTIYIISLARNYETSSTISDGKGLLFELYKNQKVILYSSCKTKSCLDGNYKSGKLQKITGQLGMSYEYNFIQDSNQYQESKIINHKCKLLPRPIKKLDITNKVSFDKFNTNTFYAKKELVGYLFFKIKASKNCTIKIRYGEHLEDGNVRYIIHDRLFELTFHLKEGINDFQSYFLRMGLRYLSIDNVDDIEIMDIGIYQAMYPHTIYQSNINDKVLQEITDKSIYTLECCMHEHYEDCPWREQAQYTMDSRTQILIGYEYFKNIEFIKASIKMMGYKLTNQNVFPITSPCNTNLSIPSYSLIYPLILKEYFENTKDSSLLKSVYKNTKTMICHYLSKLKDDILCHQNEWNFYEWEEGLANDEEIFKQEENPNQFDLPLNAFMIIGLESFAFVSKVLHKPYKKYLEIARKIQKKAHDMFIADNGLFVTYCKENNKYHLCEYSNIFAVYANIANEDEKEQILNVLTKPNNNLIPLTLSNYIFKYEVLLRDSKYNDYIIEDIKRIWGYMDKHGATTYWETILGEKDFGGAGSLCHGWSAVPAYVTNKIQKEGNKKND